jgi:cell fate regulator YaaT (PSP1 superfamily)
MITLFLVFSGEIVEIPNPTGKDFEVDEEVAVSDGGISETARILSVDGRGAPPSEGNERQLEILRHVSAADRKKLADDREKARRLLKMAQETVDKERDDIFFWDAFFSLDGKRLNLIFQAVERIQLREVLPKLSDALGRRVHLQQVGPRDRARKFGGIGHCGRPICCSHFLRSAPPVSMDSARLQGMSYRASEKISGLCGRLFCCMNFEASTYREELKDFPVTEQEVSFEGGKKKGVVLGNDVVSRKVKVRVRDHDHSFITNVALEDLEPGFRKQSERREENLS